MIAVTEKNLLGLVERIEDAGYDVEVKTQGSLVALTGGHTTVEFRKAADGRWVEATWSDENSQYQSRDVDGHYLAFSNSVDGLLTLGTVRTYASAFDAVEAYAERNFI